MYLRHKRQWRWHWPFLMQLKLHAAAAIATTTTTTAATATQLRVHSWADRSLRAEATRQHKGHKYLLNIFEQRSMTQAICKGHFFYVRSSKLWVPHNIQTALKKKKEKQYLHSLSKFDDAQCCLPLIKSQVKTVRLAVVYACRVYGEFCYKWMRLLVTLYKQKGTAAVQWKKYPYSLIYINLLFIILLFYY